MDINNFTETLPPDLPDAATLTAELREAGGDAERAAVIARYPALEILAPVPVFVQWLGMDKQSIYALRTRTRSDGKLAWPDEDDMILGTKMWRFSTIALHRATAPGRGWNLRTEIRGHRT